MKSNKGYIVATILIQMILIPILLTSGLFIVSGLTSQYLNTSSASGLGKNAVKLIYILIALFGALLVGGIIGAIFSSLFRNKPDSAKARYLWPLFPTAYAAVFALLAIIISNDAYNSTWWNIYFLKNPCFFIFDVILSLSGHHYVIPVAELSGYIGFVLGILLYEAITRTGIKNTSARNHKTVSVVICAIVIGISWFSTRDIINNGITEFRYGSSTIGNDLEEFDLMKIAPFKENNGLVKLDGQASLQFTDLKEMPRLDGATAAYPVYAAFVESVYKGLGDHYRANRDSKGNEIYSAFVSSEDYPYDIVKCSKTSEAYNNLINGQTDIIFVAEPSKQQSEAIKAKGDEFVLTPIGSEAFVFFTNNRNPVENLTISQIQYIYSGKIKNWKVVGGENRKILPYQRPENSGSQTIMQNKVMKDIKMLEPTKETQVGGMGGIISRVAAYNNARNSIGYSFMYYSSSMIKNKLIKYISVEGIKPTSETVRSKKYPFTIPVYAVTLKSNTNKNVSRFLDWIVSDEGQSLVEKTGYVSIK